MLSLMTKFPSGAEVVEVDAAADAPVSAVPFDAVGVVVTAVVDVEGVEIVAASAAAAAHD